STPCSCGPPARPRPPRMPRPEPPPPLWAPMRTPWSAAASGRLPARWTTPTRALTASVTVSSPPPPVEPFSFASSGVATAVRRHVDRLLQGEAVLLSGLTVQSPGPALNLGSYADSSWLGSPCGSTSVRTADMAHWESSGFTPGGGGIPVGQTIEVDSSGTQGNNDANAMQTFVTNGGLTSVTHPTWGVYRDVYLIMWKQANAGGQVWNSPSWTTWSGGTQHPPDRVKVDTIWCLRFYATQSFATSSQVWGEHVSCLG